MERLTLSYRLMALIAVLTLIGAAMLATPAVGEDHGHVPDPAPGILPPGDWTPDQVRKATDLVHQAEQKLPAKFGDINAVKAMGYNDFGFETPGRYSHLGLPAAGGSDPYVMDFDHPESLVYQRQDDGSQKLVAVMFVVGTTMADIPAEWAWLPGWHNHEGQFCIGDDSRVIGFPVNGQCATGHFLTAPMVHVWIVDNGCGNRFEEIDAAGVVCGADHHEPTGSMPPGSIHRGTGPPSSPPGAGGATTTSAPAGGGQGGAGAGQAPPAQPIAASPTYTG